MRVLICGGGIIGASIAYFLAQRGVASTVIERSGLACAASGKAGGFLAARAGATARSLAAARPAAASALHAQARRAGLDGDWGYRRLDTYAGSIGRGRTIPCIDGFGLALDVRGSLALKGRLGTTESTRRRSTPASLRGKRHDAAPRSGSRRGTAPRRGHRPPYGAARGRRSPACEVGGEALESATPSSSRRGPGRMLAPALAAHAGRSTRSRATASIFDTGNDLPPEALFLEHRPADGEVLSPEIFPRADGTTYIAAINSETPLPVDSANVAPNPGALDRLHAIAAAATPVLALSAVLSRQACYRPITRDGLPLIGPCQASRAPTSRRATASGASSTRRRRAKPWPN